MRFVHFHFCLWDKPVKTIVKKLNYFTQKFSSYFFYFAAENSICEDYITEKLWQNAFEHIVVPIVLRRRVVERLAPPHSFIAVDDFANVRQLANHLKYLMENREAYLYVIFFNNVKISEIG